MSRRDDDLAELSREMATRRALSPQEGDAGEAPELRFEALRDRLPIRPPWWRRRLELRLGVAFAAGVAAILVVFLRRPPEHAGIKGRVTGCGDVHLHLSHAEGERPLEVLAVRAGEPLAAYAELGAPCHAALIHADLGSKEVSRIGAADRGEGRIPLAGASRLPPLVLGDRGEHLLVLVASEAAASSAREELLHLLTSLGEGAPCEIGGQSCSVDVVKLEVR